MGRFRDSSSNDSGNESIDISPLIDVVFILLIFFIVTTVFVEEPGVEVNRPEARSAQELEKNSILIAVTDKNEVVFGGQEIGISGVQPLVRRKLADETLPVIVQVDQAADSGVWIDVVGEAKRGGAQKVSVATEVAAS